MQPYEPTRPQPSYRHGQLTGSSGIPSMRSPYEQPAGSATPIYDSLCAEYRRLFRALPGDRSGEEELRFTGFGPLRGRSGGGRGWQIYGRPAELIPAGYSGYPAHAATVSENGHPVHSTHASHMAHAVHTGHTAHIGHSGQSGTAALAAHLGPIGSPGQHTLAGYPGHTGAPGHTGYVSYPDHALHVTNASTSIGTGHAGGIPAARALPAALPSARQETRDPRAHELATGG